MEDFTVTTVPNPADEFVDVTVNYEMDAALQAQGRIVISDMASHEVYNSAISLNTNNRIDLKELTSGIYVYRIFYGDQLIHTEKLVIK